MTWEKLDKLIVEQNISLIFFGVFEWVIANIFFMALAFYIWHQIRLGGARIDLLIYLFTLIYLITFAVLLLGVTGLLYPLPLFLASLAGLLVMGWGGRFRRSYHMARDQVMESVSVVVGWPRRNFMLACFFLFIASLQVTRIAVHVWYLPPYIWDALSYRLPKVAQWIGHGGIYVYDTPVLKSFWPANYEIMETWFALFPHHDLLVDAASVPFYLLAVGSVYSIARSIELKHSVAIFVSLLYAFTPSVAIHAATVNNDLPVAALFLFIIALLFDWRGRKARPINRLVIIFLALSLAVGAKPYIVFISPGLMVIAFGLFRGSLKEIKINKIDLPDKIVIVFAVITGLFVGGYWYVRNFVLFGNPFHPTDFTLFGRLLFGSGEGHGQQGTFSIEGLQHNLGNLVHVQIFDRNPYVPDLFAITGWGWFVYSCGPAVIIYAVVRFASARWLSAGFFISLLSLLSWVAPDPYNMRFTLWFPALIALCFGLMMSKLRIWPIRWGFYVIAMICLMLNFTAELNAGVITHDQWRFLAKLGFEERSTAKLAAMGMRMGNRYERALIRIPPDEIIGYHVGRESIIYPLYDADLSRKIEYISISQEYSVVERMRRKNVKYLFVWRPDAGERKIIEKSIKTGELYRLEEGIYALNDQ